MTYTGCTSVKDLSVDEFKELIVKTNAEVFEKYEALHEEIKMLKEEVVEMRNRNRALEIEVNNIEKTQKRKNIVLKGLDAREEPVEAANNVCKNILKVPEVIIKNARKTYENNGLMTVVAEMDTESMVYESLRRSRNLQGTRISLDKDLSKDGRDNKAVMFSLKRTLNEIDASKKVTVRNDRMRVENNWFYWDTNKNLKSNKDNGKGILMNIYKNQKIEALDLDFMSLLKKCYNK